MQNAKPKYLCDKVQYNFSVRKRGTKTTVINSFEKSNCLNDNLNHIELIQ
jgi:hypothetical protein